MLEAVRQRERLLDDWLIAFADRQRPGKLYFAA